MSFPDMTVEQTVRLAVFQRLRPEDHTAESAIEAIHMISNAIINGEPTVAAAPAPGTVVYQGVAYTNIPAWATHIAADSSGYVCFFENEPVLRHGTWYAGPSGRCEDVSCYDSGKVHIQRQSQAYPALELDINK